jgi:signal transduction histidine kinase
MRGSSLATRLFLSATAWVVVILAITGIVLSSVYRDATERAFDRRLNLYLRTLIAEVATPDEPPDRQFQLGEPLFELPLSGWYWQIARTHVGNLAHAIKTPLSVIVNEAAAHGGDPFATKVLEQADVMRDQVAHHLERARIAARLTIIGTVTEVAPVIEALRRTMEKIYRGRDIAIAVEADAQAKFRGERQDLQEMAGNLVDNACKWAASRVFIEVLVERPVEPGAGPMLRIIVDDDGRGLSAAERAQVSRRGQRLDESKPGSGLGLSIVIDLAALYGGSLILGSAPIGGLRAELMLPGV